MTPSIAAASGDFCKETNHPHMQAKANHALLPELAVVSRSMLIMSSTQCVIWAPNSTAITSQHHAGNREK